MWDQYVTDSCRAAQYCATSLATVASKQTDATIKANLQGQSDALNAEATAILSMWNLYAGKSDDFIVLEGGSILETFQQVVKDASQLRVSMSTGVLRCSMNYVNANGVLTQAVAGPDPSLQASVISRIEGLGILASGILQILVSSATGAVEEVGSAGQFLAQQAKNIVQAATSPWPWVVAAVLGVSAVAIIYSPEIKGAFAAKRLARA